MPRQEFAALFAPIFPFTWGLEAQLDNTVQGTGDVSIKFKRPVEIGGFKATILPVRPLAGGGLVVPTVDDIDVFFGTDNESVWTQKINEGAEAGEFVSLSHLTIDTPRLLRIVPKGDAPDLQFQFNWAQFIQGTPIFESCTIRLGILARYLSVSERDALLADMAVPAR